jgi:hypothetical protein
VDEDRERAAEEERPADTVVGHLLTTVPDERVEGHRLQDADAPADADRD